MTDAVRYETRDGIAVLTLDNPPVNALNQQVRVTLIETLSAALSDGSTKAVLLTGKGRLFSAGADIAEFGDATRPPPYLIEVVRAFDASTKPIIAAIQGAAFGGALELAMACHYRVAAPDAKLGLSEVKFGIIPGAGGTQLLPRLIGPAKALDMITTGEPVTAREAATLGLIDQLIEGDLVAGALVFVNDVADSRPLPRASQRRDRLSAVPGLFETTAAQIDKRSRGAQAPHLAITAVRASLDLPFEGGLERERHLWAQAAASPESAAMRYLFRAERSAAKLPGAAESTSAARIDRAAVIGTGRMGTGIAIALANAGIQVTLVGRTADSVDAALAIAHRHYSGGVGKGKLTEPDMRARLARIVATTSWDSLAEVDLAIEAVVEDPDAKRATFGQLAAVCRPHAILATNTSSLNVEVVAAATQTPTRVIGLHFFSPAEATKLVEIVRGPRTSVSAIATGIGLAKQLGKICVVVGSGEGVVSTRMFNQYQREANRLLLEGALPQEVDAAMIRFGMAMGPLATSDLAGVDLGRRIRLLEQPPPGALECDAIPDRLVELGRFGQKTGCGYYRYHAGDRSPIPDPEADAAIADISKRLGLTRRSIGDAEIVRRCTAAIVAEGEAILDRGLARSAADLDVIWADAYGFPRHRGGPMYQVRQQHGHAKEDR